MSAATGVEARTIHRLLEYNFNEKAFMKDQDNPLEVDVVIIDEMSMVDCMLMDSLLKAIMGNTRLIMVGDADQLPSVGAGNVLQDIINSNIVNCIRLTDIYRQAGRSMIVTNAHRINNGQAPLLNSPENDFLLEQIINQHDCLKRIIQICVEKSTQNSNYDVQVLAPMKKGILGVHNINAHLQAALNPPSKDKKECVFGNSLYREGDKVMQIKNNYNIEWRKMVDFGVEEEGIGVFNGDIGTISQIDMKNQNIIIAFDDGAVAEYDTSQLEEIELAYCISIHKSQGSEFAMVLMPILNGPSMFMTRNLLYTAVTRAKKQVVIVGSRESVNFMSSNNNQRQRYTALKHLLTTYATVIK
jgi:exodeoxyribonuclease V alpha subunit